MIRLLVRLGQWLDGRFPEKRVVTTADYDALWRTMRTLQETGASFKDFEALNTKLGALEAKLEDVQRVAVHKDAVRDVIAAVKQVKDDVASFKTSLGFNRVVNPDLSAMLNGEIIGEPNA